MRKLFTLLAVFMLPFFVFEMSADEQDTIKEIPLLLVKGTKNVRHLTNEQITSCYHGMMSCIQTTVSEDIGDVDVYVTNCSTGESWEYSFDSSTEHQSVLLISGNPGLYEVLYQTESGNYYEGELLID